MNLPYLRLQKIAIVGTSLLLTAALGSADATTHASRQNTAQILDQPSHPLLLAQTRNFCQKNDSVFVSAETKDFWVNICGGDNPHTYVGVNKRTRKAIRLPLSDYDPQGDFFEANNGDVNYLLIRGTTKGDFLTVTQGTRELLRQPIIRWQ